MAQYYTKAQLTALLQAAKDARNISWDDLVSLFMSTECAAEYELPIDGWNIAATLSLGTAWAVLEAFSGATANATPANGGYGLLPGRQDPPNEDLFDSRLTVESANAEGWYELEYSGTVKAVSAAVQIAVAVNSTIHAESYMASGAEGAVAGKCFVDLDEGDVVQLGARGQSATDLEIRSIQFTAERILA